MQRTSRLLLLVLAMLAAVVTAPVAASAGTVREVVLDRDIDPVTQQFVVDQIHAAAAAHDEAIVLRIDTPGGLDSSMRAITQAELNSPVPVIGWVAPEGARAASAGVFVMMATDLAAMAPQTNIGSSTPVSSSGGDLPAGDLKNKIINDAVASIRAMATAHGRNADWAEQAVRKAVNVPASQALQLGVIEIIAPTMDSLLKQADGRTVKPKNITLHTANATVETHTLPLTMRILDTIIDPNILYLLLLGGIGLIAFEVLHPGVFVPGILGGIMLVMALFGLSVIPFTWTGLGLTLAGIIMIALETHVGHGALGALGVISLVVGGLLLFSTNGEATVSLPVALVTGGLIGSFFIFVVSKTAQVRRRPAATGVQRLVGQRAEARSRLDPDGLVFLHGELWRATTEEGHTVDEGEEVVVDSVDGLLVHVHPAPEEPA
jgi:membrane-bound serine protease (ClpP class)